jgi:hypothetical protein
MDRFRRTLPWGVCMHPCDEGERGCGKGGRRVFSASSMMVCEEHCHRPDLSMTVLLLKTVIEKMTVFTDIGRPSRDKGGEEAQAGHQWPRLTARTR